MEDKIAELVNKEQAAGNYTINFNGSKLAGCIYLYTFSAGDFTSIKTVAAQIAAVV
ncbi:MAG: hypothetical protein K9J16_16665 [Melioribacteraceae bacterium]|nr:hypothetical protein [Melioribacteraceae bacterium]MCF8355238.1 hypothetical protein [Melioribacteraceae bacterium]MCF8395225.1 hypothetical protein [Melioribacteraceae bacterium]MCF8420699.1 hypothetical protein [Melioribacteraceae bacterium]